MKRMLALFAMALFYYFSSTAQAVERGDVVFYDVTSAVVVNNQEGVKNLDFQFPAGSHCLAERGSRIVAVDIQPEKNLVVAEYRDFVVNGKYCPPGTQFPITIKRFEALMKK